MECSRVRRMRNHQLQKQCWSRHHVSMWSRGCYPVDGDGEANSDMHKRTASRLKHLLHAMKICVHAKTSNHHVDELAAAHFTGSCVGLPNCRHSHFMHDEECLLVMLEVPEEIIVGQRGSSSCSAYALCVNGDGEGARNSGLDCSEMSREVGLICRVKFVKWEEDKGRGNDPQPTATRRKCILGNRWSWAAELEPNGRRIRGRAFL